mmetsp:Transcript_61067/g.196749  ORF Transcript_61067/g.196749 Transcript_61067/m.196749 type:complete len:80 (+) Transcript_61067:3-242(+)
MWTAVCTIHHWLDALMELSASAATGLWGRLGLSDARHIGLHWLGRASGGSAATREVPVPHGSGTAPALLKGGCYALPRQ